MCQKWFVKFRAGDGSLDDAPWSGRPGEVDSDQIATLTENSQHSTTRETADTLKISKSKKLSVKVKNVSVILRKKTHGLVGQPNMKGGLAGVLNHDVKSSVVKVVGATCTNKGLGTEVCKQGAAYYEWGGAQSPPLLVCSSLSFSGRKWGEVREGTRV